MAHTLAILTLWCIWRKRNAAVFTNSTCTARQVFTMIRDECSLWAHAGGRVLRPLIDANNVARNQLLYSKVCCMGLRFSRMQSLTLFRRFLDHVKGLHVFVLRQRKSLIHHILTTPYVVRRDVHGRLDPTQCKVCIAGLDLKYMGQTEIGQDKEAEASLDRRPSRLQVRSMTRVDESKAEHYNQRCMRGLVRSIFFILYILQRATPALHLSPARNL